MATYEVILRGRAPQASGPPIMEDLFPIKGSFWYEDRLYGAGPGEFVVNTNTLPESIKQRLRDLKGFPTEVQVRRDAEVVYAGPVTSGAVTSGASVRLETLDLRGYLMLMGIVTDEAWTAADSFTLAAGWIDTWQALSYGDFGLDTSALTTSGVLRTGQILGATEPTDVYSALLSLGEGDDGLTFYVDPDTRAVVLDAPMRGSDLTETVFLERGITSAEVRFMAWAGTLASEVYVTVTGGEVFTSVQSSATVREAFGRTFYAESKDGLQSQAEADAFALGALGVRSEALFVPGPGLIPVAGAGITDFSPGDVVTYSHDAGIGTQTGSFIVDTKRVDVDTAGTERMAVNFL